MRRFRLLIVCVGLLAAGPVTAQTGQGKDFEFRGAGSGLVNAVTYKPFPAGHAIAVQALSDSDKDLALKKEFEKVLKEKGYAVAKDAKLVLTFETRDSVGAWSDGGRRSWLSVQGRGGRDDALDEDQKVVLNLYNNQSGGVLNSGKNGTRIVTPSQYRIDATIDDNRTGARLWQGWAVADLAISDSLTLTKAMVPELIDSLGSTVRQKRFVTR